MTGGSDYYLQQAAARTNAFISNNSWTYADNDYDLAAASYDAAVRDALPDVPGSQPVLFVFATGANGMVNSYDDGSDDNGQGGSADTILSPATAKNVITVGAIEQLRSITNDVSICTLDPGATNGVDCTTNQPWLPSTDSGDPEVGFQVAKCSGRGNVGVYVEGNYGRFKPDVVAPGTFVVSTRSAQWDQAAYYNPTSYLSSAFNDEVVDPGGTNLWLNAVFIPAAAVQVTITVVPDVGSPVPFPNLPIFVRQADFPTTTNYDYVGTNRVSLPPDLALNPVNANWYFGVGNPTSQSVQFDVQTVITATNLNGNFFQVLSNMNDSLGVGTYYRYETGTSMSAADVSGMLALMQEFFQQRLGRTNSPALMKALLINGARSLGVPYDFGTTNDPNFQGWGLVNLPTTIQGALINPGASATSMLVFDQSPDTALATGQSLTRSFTVSTNAQNAGVSLRATLVWTDPPGNPVAGVKLVNNLNLIVTNLDTGEVFFGNDIPAGNTANQAWVTNTVPNLDVVNNVQNVYLGTPLGTNYSVTVVGQHVNVNAVSANLTNVVQDYALVVSCGDGQVTNALALTQSGALVSANVPYVTPVGNMFTNAPQTAASGFEGGILLGQHVGASSPLVGTNTVSYPVLGNAVITLGVKNQWHFYMVTNSDGYTNAAFMTFNSLTLALPRMGVTNTFNPTNATEPGANIDLYVSTDAALTNLDTAAVSNAWKSVAMGGDQTIMLTNAATGVYYAGVKSEDQLAAEYGFMGVFSLNPFGGTMNGNPLLQGFPPNAPIPDCTATPPVPGVALIFAVSPTPVLVHRVVVYNTITHQLVGDLLGTLTHNGSYVVLNNHDTNQTVINWMNIYDDSDEHNIPGAHRTDGPGSLMNFAGKPASGQWVLSEVDNAYTHVGTNNLLQLYIEKQLDLRAGIYVNLLPGACDNEYVQVPADATGLIVAATVVSNVGPVNVSMQLCPLASTANGCKSTVITNQLPTSLSIGQFDTPPLSAGTYYVRLCNNGVGEVTLFVKATIQRNRGAVAVSVPASTGPVTIQDDSVTYAHINVTNHMMISDLDVGLLINDPRISGLAITLISPNGDRVLLFQNRGGTSTNGLGTFDPGFSSSGLPSFAYTSLEPFWTNNFNSAAVGPYGAGSVFDGWTVITNEVYVFPDYSVPWLTNNFLILGEGAVSNSLPTTNSTQYELKFRATHAPYLAGMVSWWPFDGDARDIFGGLNGLLSGDVIFTNGEVGQAYYGDGIATEVVVPASPNLNLPGKYGLSIEGWINPANVSNSAPLLEWFDPNPTNPSPLGVQLWLGNLSTTSSVPGALSAALRDTNSQTYYVFTGPQVLTNGGWQHVALTYDAGTRLADLYVNGRLAGTRRPLPAGTVLRGNGDVYLGFDPASSPPVSFDYSDFTSLTGLDLAGTSALANGNTLRLTPAAPETAGAAWYWQKLLCSGGFSTSFSFQITAQGSAAPGTDDPRGFSFMIQNVGPEYQPEWWHPTNSLDGWRIPAWSVSTQAITLSFIVNGDDPYAWNLLDGCAGLGAFWIGPATGGVLGWHLEGTPPGFRSVVLNRPAIDVGDGDVHLARIEFDGGFMNVFVDNEQVFSEFSPADWPSNGLFDGSLTDQTFVMPGASGILDSSIPFAECTAWDAGGYSWVGFNSANSPAFENHDIRSWSFTAGKPGLSYAGGLDEFSLYSRALSPQEVKAIYNTGPNGKYGTNALTCPVAMQVSLGTGPGQATSTTYTFTNGLGWATNGLAWETNTIDFSNILQFASTNGAATNFASIVLTPLDPNVTVDDFVLSSVTTNYQNQNGLMYFTDNTNLAVTPIKFAPAPYVLSNGPPTLVFSSGFPLSTGAVFATGSTIPATTNSPAIGIRDWTVVQGPVTVVSNALVDAMSTNFLALATGTIQTTLPTIPGQRYQLNYTFRGPGAVSWWNGAVNPLDGRLQDLLGGNDGALINGAISVPAPESFVGNQGWFLPGMLTNGVDGDPYFGGNIQLGDPENLRLTNGFTIEGWINPLNQTNKYVNTLGPGTFVEQVLFRGDSRECAQPYYFALQRASAGGVTPEQYDLVFHIGEGLEGDCGVVLETADHPIAAGNWLHVAAVFESNYQWADKPSWPTNMLHLYINGVLYTNVLLVNSSGQTIDTSYTGEFPFRNLDPAYSPGVAIGNASRANQSQPYYGFMDELSVYGRALTDPEINAIYTAGSAGKADFTVAPAQSLAKLSVSLDGVQMDVANGDNGQWDSESFLFTAEQTNSVLTLQGLLPGTLLDGVSLTAVPSQLYYQPENSLDPLLGTDAFGAWTLEIQDTDYGAGAATNLAQLVTWRLDFQLLPSNPPPVIELSHGIPYTNTLVGLGAQDFIVQVPLWATNATNVLLSALDLAGNPQPMGVLYDANTFPTTTANALIWPPAGAPQAKTLSTNAASQPLLLLGKPYYLTVTNPNPTAVEFAIGVWFNILTLTNCETITNAVVGPAGIPTYFQFDVPTNGAPPGLPQNVAFWLGNDTTNLTVVLSQHLPLPDLDQHDYISRQPGPNAEIVMVVDNAVSSLGSSVIGTNSTPWPIQTNRWYVGVFNAAQTNISFAAEACYTTNYPAIIPLANGVPYTAGFASQYVAPPGAPRTAFFQFQITDSVDGVLFELYNLSGNADLVLQRDALPTMAPYFASSFQPGAAPEQIVVRTSAALPDLRGFWYLGVFNNDLSGDIDYTIRATLPEDGILVSALPTVVTNQAYASGYVLLSWYSVVGDWYTVSWTDNVSTTNALANLLATTPVTTWLAPALTNGSYTVTPVPGPTQVRPQLTIQLWTNHTVRISWPTNFQGFTLQYSLSITAPVWVNLSPPAPVLIEGPDYVFYDSVATKPKYYRLVQQ
jgi:subtilisin-like proprotein convertase family protein